MQHGWMWVKKCIALVYTDTPTNITLVTFTLCIVTSEIAETVDAVTKTGWLILTEIRRRGLITQMAVIGTGTETSQTCKQCTNDFWIYWGFQNVCFLKRWTISFVGMWMLILDSGANELSIFLRSNDVDLNMLHDEIKLDNEVANFW